MLDINKSSICQLNFKSPVKLHEIIAIWLGVMLAWNYVLSHINFGIPNFVYLQWGGVALTMLILSKHFIRRENLTIDDLMGREWPRRCVVEILIAILLCILAGIASWAVLVFLSATVDMEWAYNYWQLMTAAEFQDIKWRRSWLVIYFICGGVLVPVAEEIVFRGFVLRRLCEKYRMRTAVVISAILFSVIHFNKDFLGAFLIGIVLAVLAVRFSSLYVTMFAHGAYNTVVSLARCGYGQFMVVDKNHIDSIDYWLPEVILLSVCVIAVFAYLRFGPIAIRGLRQAGPLREALNN